MLFLFFCLICEPALTFLKTIDKPSMSMVSHKTIHSMAMVGLEKTIGKTIDTNGWNLKNHWKTIDTNGSHVKNHWKTIGYNGTLTKTINHSTMVKILPSFRSKKYYLAGTVSPVSHVPVFLWPGLYFVSCLYYELSLLYIIFLLGRGYSNSTLLWIFLFDHKH